MQVPNEQRNVLYEHEVVANIFVNFCTMLDPWDSRLVNFYSDASIVISSQVVASNNVDLRKIMKAFKLMKAALNAAAAL